MRRGRPNWISRSKKLLEHALHVLHVVVVDLLAQLALDLDEHLHQKTHLLMFEALLHIVAHLVRDLVDGMVLAVAQHLFQGFVETVVDALEGLFLPLAAVDSVSEVEGEEQIKDDT